MDDHSNMTGFVLIALTLAIYFLPTLFAERRNVRGWGIMFVVNLVFGWTIVGWFFCLAWAALGRTKEQDEFYRRALARESGADV